MKISLYYITFFVFLCSFVIFFRLIISQSCSLTFRLWSQINFICCLISKCHNDVLISRVSLQLLMKGNMPARIYIYLCIYMYIFISSWLLLFDVIFLRWSSPFRLWHHQNNIPLTIYTCRYLHHCLLLMLHRSCSRRLILSFQFQIQKGKVRSNLWKTNLI